MVVLAKLNVFHYASKFFNVFLTLIAVDKNKHGLFVHQTVF